MTSQLDRLTQAWGDARTLKNDAQRAYDRALKVAESKGIPPPTSRDFATLRAAHEHLVACTADVERATDALEYHHRRQAREQDRKRRETSLRRTLTQQYGDLGPQYALVVDRLVTVALTAEAMDEDPHIFDVDEYSKLVYQTKALVDQLQKHTESVKTEVLNKKIEMQVIRVLEIAERVIAPESPKLWQRALQSIGEEMPRLEHTHLPALAAEN